MPQAKITLAGTKADNTAFGPTAGSQLDAKINSVVNLDNLNSGGELTFTWSILDQPPGAADALSSVSAQNPFFTPKKEGSYLIRLIVNQSLPTEQEDRVVLAVAQLKTRERMPAAGETTESDTSDGWAVSMNALLRRVDFLLSDPGILVGVNISGGTLTRGQIVRAPGTDIIKNTLPGQETVPGFTTVSAATLSTIDELLCVVEGTPFGLPGVPGVGSAEQRLMRTRYIGRIAALPIAGPPPTAGDVLFVNDAGAISSIQGTIRRRVGSSMTTGSPADVWFNGVGGADIDLPSIAEPYVTNGPSALPNAFRIDGSNAGARTAAMGPFEVHTGDVATPTTRWRRFSAAGASIGEWTTEAGAALVRVTATGQLVIEVGAGGLFVNSVGIALAATLPFTQNIAGSPTVQFSLDDTVVQLGRRQLKFSADDGFGNTFDNYMVNGPLGSLGTRSIHMVNQTNLGVGRFEFISTGDGFGGVRVDLLLHASTGTDQYITNQQGNLSINTFQSQSVNIGWATGGALNFFSAFTQLWQMEGLSTGGALSAIGGNRFIHNVADPVANQDAATKQWVGDQAGYRNICHNGNFGIWGRGTTAITLSNNVLGYGAVPFPPLSRYRADRWYAFFRIDVVGTGIGANSLSYGQVGSGLTNTLNAARVTYTAETATTPGQGFICLTQDIDREFVKQARGKKLTLVFKWAKGATMGDVGLIEFVAGTGNIHSNLFNYTGASIISSEFVSNAAIPTVLGANKVHVTSAIVPTNATTLAFYIGREIITASLPGATNFLDITDVVLVIGDVPNISPYTHYPHCGGSMEGEIDICQRYYESNSLYHEGGGVGNAHAGANPGTTDFVEVWTGFRNYAKVNFRTRKRIDAESSGFGSMIFWSGNGTVNSGDSYSAGVIGVGPVGFRSATEWAGYGEAGLAVGGEQLSCQWACDVDF